VFHACELDWEKDFSKGTFDLKGPKLNVFMIYSNRSAEPAAQTPSAASLAEPTITPDVLVWYVLASPHRQQRLSTTLLYLCAPAAALLAAPTTTPDVLVWCHQRSSLPACLLTDSQLIEAVLNAAGPNLHFAVK